MPKSIEKEPSPFNAAPLTRAASEGMRVEPNSAPRARRRTLPSGSDSTSTEASQALRENLSRGRVAISGALAERASVR
jgi:hypothetical protein